MSGLVKEDIIALLEEKDVVYFIASSQYDKVFEILEASFDTVAQNLREARFIKENYIQLLKCLYFIRCLSPNIIDKSKKDRIYLKICIASSFIDSLNSIYITNVDNTRSCIVFLYEISKLITRYPVMEDNEKILLSFSSAYYKTEKVKDDSNYILDKFVVEMGKFYKRPEVVIQAFTHCSDNNSKIY
jgi:hypothetical protein